MRSNFQDEVPKSRINITLDVDVGGAASKKELPLKMLVLGDFLQKNPGLMIFNLLSPYRLIYQVLIQFWQS